VKRCSVLTPILFAMLVAVARAQTTAPAPMPTIAPKAEIPGPPPPLDSKVVPTLKMLQDRPATLKDFTGKVDYSVFHPRTLDTDGKRGMIDFLADPVTGLLFTADFTEDTEGGLPVRKHHQQVIFDGKFVALKDFDVKQYTRNDVLPPGAKPGDAISLSGDMPLPIGLKVDDVARNFEVTLLPSTDPNQTNLRLVPRIKDKFSFQKLDVTIDNMLQLPVKMVQTGLGDSKAEVTTITLTELSINTGKAKMESTIPPAGWKERGK
jgi:hypothetical protein